MIAVTMVDTEVSEDVDDDWVVEYGRGRRAQAQALLREVEMLLSREKVTEAEKVARRSLGLFASSLNWLEDTAEFDRAHELMDLAGRYVRLSFGCQLRWQGEYYEQRCPVWIAHARVGFSPELLIRRYECSICGTDPVTCPHISGREYNGEVCIHKPEGFEAIGSVALVARPAQPDARIQVLPMTVDELKPFVPSEWRPGMPVACSRCLHPCTGVEEIDLSAVELDDEIESPTDDEQPPWTISIMLADTPMKA